MPDHNGADFGWRTGAKKSGFSVRGDNWRQISKETHAILTLSFSDFFRDAADSSVNLIMQIVSNTTPFFAECFVSTDKHGQKHCVVVVKATFDVAPDGQCTPAQDRIPFVYVDQQYGDPARKTVACESDFAPLKPRIDVLLHGFAIAPENKEVTSLRVDFAGPGFRKSAIVTGDRTWIRSGAGLRASAPQAFHSMPLSWDRAFGGIDDTHADIGKHGSELRNPAGVGFHLNKQPDSILGRFLPNIEKEGAQMRSWQDKPEPIGFAAVGRGWQPRIGFGGTYDQRWREQRCPFLPEDFDSRYFQSAPADQQLRELPAAARFTCSNMGSDGLFIAETPAFEVPIRFRLEQRSEQALVVADTVIIEPNRAKLILLGRTSIALPRKLSLLREIHVGARPILGGKPHFTNLAELVAFQRRERSAR